MQDTNTFSVRKAQHEDVTTIMEIIDLAKEDMQASGNNQWQNGTPNAGMLHADIDRGVSYVLCDADGSIQGTAYISTEQDPTYKVIWDGAWRAADEPYTVIHRVAVRRSERGRGLALHIVNFAKTVAAADGTHQLRIDTHEKNIPMQHFLARPGFSRRGIIQSGEGPRIAYDYFF